MTRMTVSATLAGLGSHEKDQDSGLGFRFKLLYDKRGLGFRVQGLGFRV